MSDLMTAPPTTTAAAPSTAPSTWDRVKRYSPPSRFLPVIATFALFVGLFGLGEFRYSGFADPQVFLSLLIDNSFLIVLAVGMTFVILTGGIDLSVGSVVALSTMIAARTLQLGWPPLLVMAVVLLCGAVLGTVMGADIFYREPALGGSIHRDRGVAIPDHLKLAFCQLLLTTYRDPALHASVLS